MEDYVNILFYSKFSAHCTKIKADIEGISQLKDNIILVCIDSEEVRNRINESVVIGPITKVPCIIKLYDIVSEGEEPRVEKYEGDLAFNYIQGFEHNIGVVLNENNTKPPSLVTTAQRLQRERENLFEKEKIL